jgi:hypothetical protein
MRSVVYTDDNNLRYLCKLDARYLAQGDLDHGNFLGAEVWDGTGNLKTLPRHIKPRTATYTTPTYMRRLICFTKTAFAYENTPPTLTLYDGLGTAHEGATRLRTSTEKYTGKGIRAGT